MALSEFEFHDEGPLNSAECNNVPDNLMIIAGPNGVGKTTLLENIASSIERKLMLPTDDGDTVSFTEAAGYNPVISEEDVRRVLNPQSVGFSARNNVTLSDSTNAALVGPHRGMSGNIDIEERRFIGMPNYSSKFLYSISMAGQDRRREYLNSGNGSIRSGPYRRGEKGTVDELPYYEVRRRLAQIYHNRKDYVMEKWEQNKYISDGIKSNWISPLESAISEVLPGIELDGISGTDDNRYVLEFTNQDGATIAFSDLSSGEKDAVALLFLLIEDEIEQYFLDTDIVNRSDEDLVILYDSPEAYLHPQLQLNFINYIKDHLNRKRNPSRNIQVIMCTHSKMIIDNVSDKSLYYLFYPDQVEDNQLRPASSIASELQDIISKEMGLTALSSGEDILLVEGKDDREVFHRIYDSIEKELSLIQMGGKDQIVESAFNNLIPELHENGVGLYAIVDRDRDLALDERVSDNIHTLPVTSVENLVLKPKAIYNTVEYVRGRRELNKMGYKSPDDIQDLLTDIVTNEQFIEWESQKRWNEQFNPIFIDYDGFKSSEKFDNIETFARNRVDNRLSDVTDFHSIRREVKNLAENGEFDRLLGKRILSQVSDEFEIKERRLLRMCAERVEPDDLPEETRNFLRRARSQP